MLPNSPLPRRRNLIESATNCTANSIANGMNTTAKVPNSSGNGIKSTAKVTNSIAKTCTNLEIAAVGALVM